MIRAVTFDFYGTLYEEGDSLARRQRLRNDYALGFFIGMGAAVNARQLGYAFEILSHDIEHFRLTRHVALSASELGQRLARVVGVELDGDQGRRLAELISSAGREEPPRPAPQARQVLALLRGRYKLGLISDTSVTLGQDLYGVMEADGIAQFIDHFTFSDQTGTTKPEARQFLYTLHRLGCPPETAVHVGDLEQADVAGAKAAGMRAIRLLRPEHAPATAADAAVEGLHAVPRVLRAWEQGL